MAARMDLSKDALFAEARRQTGLDHFGDPGFVDGLQTLLDSLDAEAGLNASGRLAATNAILRSLRNRLWAQACFDARPEILDHRITAPVIVVGPVRSGTTRLQRMLATDSRFRHLKAWEGFNPAPRGSHPGSGAELRRREVVDFLAALRSANPGADAAHPMDADWAEEEILLLNHSFGGLSPVLLYRVPGYARWLLDNERSGAYREMANWMRLIAWSRGDREDAPWIMKTPQYMLDLDVLARLFPDARFIFIHRDPVRTTASTLSLAWNFSAPNTDVPSRASIRDTWLGLCERMARECIRGRQRLPGERQFDVYYEDMNADWRAVMRGIYGFLGVENTPAAERGMSAWLAESEAQNRHGSHRYSPEDFGICAAEIEERMSFYRREYDIPHEDRPDGRAS